MAPTTQPPPPLLASDMASEDLPHSKDDVSDSRGNNNDDADDDSLSLSLSVNRFGFTEDAEEAQGVLELTKKQKLKFIAKTRKRELKWLDMKANWDLYSIGRKRAVLIRRCKKGIPDSMRAMAWELLANGRMINLQRLIDTPCTKGQPAFEYMDVIERDLHRTYPTHELFLKRNGIGQSEMRDMLQAYAKYNPSLGYCQGMGMIAGFLLMHIPKEKAFHTFVQLVESEKYLKGMFESGLREAQVCMKATEILMKKKLPLLSTHLESQMVPGALFMVDWFLCAFSKTLPWDCVLRIWDMFLCEGRVVLFRTAMSILAINQHNLLRTCPTIQELMTYLRNLPRELCSTSALLPLIIKPVVDDQQISAALAAANKEIPKKKEDSAA